MQVGIEVFVHVVGFLQQWWFCYRVKGQGHCVCCFPFVDLGAPCMPGALRGARNGVRNVECLFVGTYRPTALNSDLEYADHAKRGPTKTEGGENPGLSK